MPPLTGAEPAANVGPLYFRDLGGGVLLTNDWGGHLWLPRAEFTAFVSGSLAPESAPWRELLKAGFLRNHLDFAALGAAFMRRNAPLSSGPATHLIALTYRNDQDTPYGKAARADARPDMTLATARRVARFIFESPAAELCVELRGGEPLHNWEVVNFLVPHLQDFAASANRKLRIGLATNMSHMDEGRLAFLVERGVELCVPLDGPADLHDRLRSWPGGSSHAQVERWLRVYAQRYPAAPRPRAWLNVTRDSLGRAGDIVAEYSRLGLGELQPRPIWPLGRARRDWGRLGFSAAEYLAFYRDCLRLLLASDRRPPMRERTASLLLAKILRGEDPGFAELRALYGGGFGELAYDCEGGVYLSDEGRWHCQEEGHSLFHIGTVDMGYQEVVQHPSVRACAVASDLEAQPLCSQCAYKPFCGVSPVYNLAAQGTIWGRNPTNDRCVSYMGVFDLLFEGLRDPGSRGILESWAEASPRELGQPAPAFLSVGVL